MTSAQIKPSFTVSSSSLGAIKRRFIISLNILYVIGVIIAIYQIFTHQVGWFEMAMFLSMTICSSLGVTVGYHRHFSHKAFKAHPIVRIVLGIFGSMAGHGSLIAWVSVHRCHHQYSDQPGDPHSPRLDGDDMSGKLRGLWHAHLGWLLDDNLPNSLIFAKDLIQDKPIVVVNRLYPLWLILGFLLPSVIGGVVTHTWYGVMQGFIWGGLVRQGWTFHSGCTINSIVHVFGQRFLSSHDHSKNNIWLAIPTFGEGWHNNHHAFPHSAKFGLKWWQIDLGYGLIKVLQWIGLAWDVKIPSYEMIEAKKIA
ncbi:acyl-CoA desaturase [Crocosphaera sp.]|uniref:acyl-CoA desaturase n=1 Tax=Crocosphaera sp. TaxID=2729996 RepID=UPI003F1F6C21|nr:acyl-CoA desaturase [Crocosphaera sp.]